MIEINNIIKKINDNVILNGIDIKLEKGKIYGFVGKNGSGKSILFKSICGFLEPNEGSVVINDVDIYKEKTFPKSTRAVIDNHNFIEYKTGLENLINLASIENNIVLKDIIHYLKVMDLFKYKDKKVREYSLGMKQKLAIVQVLMEDPEIMIFDEPFNGLDESSVKKLKEIIIRKKNENRIILVSSHIKNDIEELCDEAFLMENGKIIERKVLECKQIFDKENELDDFNSEIDINQISDKRKYNIIYIILSILIISISLISYSNIVKGKLEESKELYKQQSYYQAAINLENYIYFGQDISYKKILFAGYVSSYYKIYSDNINEFDIKTELGCKYITQTLFNGLYYSKIDPQIMQVKEYRLLAYSDVETTIFKDIEKIFKIDYNEFKRIMDLNESDYTLKIENLYKKLYDENKV